MPSSAEQPAERRALARQAARRREAATVLAIGECMCRYAAGQLGNGIGPAEARATALEAAAELTVIAEALRRLLLRLCPACGRPVDTTPRPGRPRVWCSERCRWKGDSRAARRAARRRDTAAARRPGRGA